MSLKAFHVVFVAMCVVFATGFGFWAVRNYGSSGEVASLVWGIGSFAGAVGLCIYGVWFLRKLKGVSYL